MMAELYTQEAPYDAELERGYLIHDCSSLLAYIYEYDGILHVRCADGRFRPLDRDTTRALDELRWTMELSYWRKGGRKRHMPRDPHQDRNDQIRAAAFRTRHKLIDRLRVILGRAVS